MKVARVRTVSVLAIVAIGLVACQPPAADSYVERSDIKPQGRQASDPIPSPDVKGAVWAEVDHEDRLIYGKPGATPLFAIGCLLDRPDPQLRLTRYSPADEGAKAFMPVIGNGHVARLKIDATPVGEAFLWQGETPLDNDRLEALTGARSVEATVPGAGSLKLNASGKPGQLIERCRAKARAAKQANEPAQQVPEAGPA